MRFSKVATLVTVAAAPFAVQAELLDVCANVNVNLFGLLGLINLGGLLDVCLCLSALPVFIETNVVAKLAVTLVGAAPVLNTLTETITNGKGSQHCTYPDYCTPVCNKGNPCDWECPKPRVKKDGKCVCPAPYYECNGKCTDKPCPSAYPKAKRDLYPLESLCAAGESLCGIWTGQSNAAGNAWECLNTQRNLESCGGCVTPIPGQRASGRDCTAIPGVSNVECVYGECVVSKCKAGWKVTSKRDGCFSTRQPVMSAEEAFVVMNAGN